MHTTGITGTTGSTGTTATRRSCWVNTISAASNLALAILLILPTLPLALQALLIHVFINVIQEVMTDYTQEVIQETKPWWYHC